jgi:lauroyl/myristoyl acyltransferase
MIATQSSGLEAIRLMDGRTVGDVRRALQAKYGTSSPPRLDGLMRSLSSANLIATIDGKRVSQPELTIQTISRFILLYYVAPFALRAAKHLLPISHIPRVVSAINYLCNPQRIRRQRELGAANIATIFYDLPQVEVAQIQSGQRRYLTTVKLDPELLFDRDPKEVDRWLAAHFECAGLDRLREAAAASSGAVAAILHMNRFTLAPLALLRNGFNICLVGSASIVHSGRRRANWYRSLSQLPGYGEFELLPDFTLGSVRRALHLLERGYVVAGYPDAAPPPMDDAAIRDRMKFFGIEYTQFRTSTVDVRLRNHFLSAANWFCWFACYAKAALVPAVTVATRRGSQLMFSDPLYPSRDRAAATAQLATQFFSFWQACICRCPSDWFGWHSLQYWHPRMVAAQDGQSGCLKDEARVSIRYGTV